MTPKLFWIEPLPGTDKSETTFISLDLVAVINLRGDIATITLNLAYVSIPTTRACGQRLIELMSKDDNS